MNRKSLHLLSPQDVFPFNLRNCYNLQKTNRKIMIQLDQVFLPRWTTMRCVLFLSNCPVDHATILSVEYPELLVAPRKRVLCPQLDQLYPQLDEPATKISHIQALKFKQLPASICRFQFTRYFQQLFSEQRMDNYFF